MSLTIICHLFHHFIFIMSRQNDISPIIHQNDVLYVLFRNQKKMIRMILLLLLASMSFLSQAEGKVKSKNLSKRYPNQVQVIHDVVSPSDQLMNQLDSIFMAHLTLFDIPSPSRIGLAFKPVSNEKAEGCIIIEMSDMSSYYKNTICKVNGRTYYFDWNEKNGCFLKKHFKKIGKPVKRIYEVELSIVGSEVISWLMLYENNQLRIVRHLINSDLRNDNCFCLPYECDTSYRFNFEIPLMGR